MAHADVWAPRNDPSETGGLFIGRRPGTARVAYDRVEIDAPPMRRALDRTLAALLLLAEVVLLATLWGPQPAAWLWVGSRIQYWTGSITTALVVAFAGMLAAVLATIAAAKAIDAAWVVVRRAAGHDQRDGVLERIFATSIAIGGIAFAIWFFGIEGPGPTIGPRG